MKKIVFIINPISGTGSKDAIPALIGERIDTERYTYEIVFTEYAGHASEITRDCVSRGIDIVVAVGGDGTVNEVARALVGSSTALAIIPCGSGNGLARHLMLPTTIERTLDIINEGIIHDLDYGVINGHPFFGYFVGPADMSYKEAKEKGLLYDIHTGEQVLLEQ